MHSFGIISSLRIKIISFNYPPLVYQAKVRSLKLTITTFQFSGEFHEDDLT